MLNKLHVFLEMIKFEHTIFALPFAYISVFLAEGKMMLDSRLVWITLAMVAGRTTAMALNRIIDRYIDARNPRTKNRALPKGMLQAVDVWVYTAVCIFLFFLSAYMLSELAVKVAPFCLFAFVFYPYTKRFTWLCHFVLGLTIGLAPLSAWIGITNDVSIAGFVLSMGVALWVAGFDIIYACDDYEYDCKERLYSIPAQFGIERALKISAFTHMGATVFFIATGFLLNLGFSYWTGLVAAMLLMYKQHELISQNDLAKINVAFFNMNGTLSIVMFFATLLDLGVR